jgi:hypothetical protein
MRERYCGRNTAGEILREKYCGWDTAGGMLRERILRERYCGWDTAGGILREGAQSQQSMTVASGPSSGRGRDRVRGRLRDRTTSQGCDPMVGDAIGQLPRPAWRVSITRRVSSRNRRYFGGAAYCAEIVDARACGVLGFRGMRGEHALRGFSHQPVPRCRHFRLICQRTALPWWQPPTISSDTVRSDGVKVLRERYCG